jgi:hypothetical protein
MSSFLKSADSTDESEVIAACIRLDAAKMHQGARLNHVVGSLQIVLLDLLFQRVHRLLVLGACRNRLVAREMARRIDLEHAGLVNLNVKANHDHGHAERTHRSVLGIHLVDIRHSLGKHVHRNVVAVLVLPLGGFLSGTRNLGPRVGCTAVRQELDNTHKYTWRSIHNAADQGRDGVQGRHGVGVDQLVLDLLLRHDDGRDGRFDGHGSRLGVGDGFKGVFCTDKSRKGQQAISAYPLGTDGLPARRW